MKIRNPDPDGEPQEMVIPDLPHVVEEWLGQGWSQVSAPLVRITHPEHGVAHVNGDELDTYTDAGWSVAGDETEEP